MAAMSSSTTTAYRSADMSSGKPTPRPSGIPISRSRILSSSPRTTHQPDVTSRARTEVGTTGHEAQASTSKTRNPSMAPQKTPAAPRKSDQNPSQHLATPLRNIVRSVSDRSMDRQSIDSVQLAMKLGRAVGEGEGEGWFVDEVAPFVTGDGAEGTRGTGLRDGELVAAEERSRKNEEGEVVSSGSFPREINLDDDTSFSDNLQATPPIFEPIPRSDTLSPLHAPLRTSQRFQTPPLPKPIPKSASGPIARTTPPSARSRTVNALKSTHPPRSASGSSLSTPRTSQTQSKKSPSMNSIASSLTRSHGSGSLTSSTSTTKYYPAEAYMVPRIREYEVAEAGWDDTVLPTVARKLQRDSGASAGVVEEEVGDQLVTEWTPDGRPVRLEKVQGSKVRTYGNGAMRIAEEGVSNGQAAVLPLSAPLAAGDDNAVLDDVLRDFDMEDAAGDRSLAPDMQHAGVSETKTTGTLTGPLNRAGDPTASDDPTMADSSPLNNGREEETGKPDIVLGRSLPPEKPAADTPLRHSPSQAETTQVPRQDLRTASTTSKPSNTTQASRVATGNNVEMRNMEKRTGPEVKRSAGTTRSQGKSGSKEEHGGGCRCVVM